MPWRWDQEARRGNPLPNSLKCMMRPNGFPFVSFIFKVSQQYVSWQDHAHDDLECAKGKAGWLVAMAR